MNKVVGILGCGVMGHNLALNLNDHGYTVIACEANKHRRSYLKSSPEFQSSIALVGSTEELLEKLPSPAIILMLLPAGEIIDSVINDILDQTNNEIILIDCGNSYFKDTQRRTELLADNPKITYLGMGVSGGEEGARNGPSLMPGGDIKAWPQVEEMLKSISAKDSDGEQCCSWMGSEGSGHFVKMIHNGIEYAIMQIIAEIYLFMSEVLNQSDDQISTCFEELNKGQNASYLLEISARILATKDKDGSSAISKIRRNSGQKGTGMWTAQTALEYGVPAGVLTEAVYARYASSPFVFSHKSSKTGRKTKWETSGFSVSDINNTLLSATLVAYQQGLALINTYYSLNKIEMDIREVAKVWRAGCILRSKLIDEISNGQHMAPEKAGQFNINLEPLHSESNSIRTFVKKAIDNSIPVPCISAAVFYLDTYNCDVLPANLIQAQRDFFGSHTYKRTDYPPSKNFHRDWSNSGEEYEF